MLGSSVRDVFKAPLRYFNERLPARPSGDTSVSNALKENHFMVITCKASSDPGKASEDE